MRATDICSELAAFGGLPVYDLPDPRESGDEPFDWSVLPQDVENHAWRVSVGAWGGDATILDRLDDLFGRVDMSRVRALVIGSWVTDQTVEDTSAEIVERLIEAADMLPRLRALFIGDVAPDRWEISWIRQSDVTPLLTTFRQLEELGVKGGEGLDLAPVAHENLRWLSIRTGGLGAGVVRAVGASSLPALQTLELCLGDCAYGNDTTVEDLAGILSGERLPALRRLALADAENTDAVADAVAHAPVVARLDVLDLSLGDLGDEGVESLLAGQSLTHLTSLDLNHNFVTEPVAARLLARLPTVAVNLDPDDAYTHDGRRYIAVSE